MICWFYKYLLRGKLSRGLNWSLMGFLGAKKPFMPSSRGTCKRVRDGQREWRNTVLMWDHVVDPSTYLSLVTHGDVEPLQDLHDGQLHGHLSKPHPDAVPGPETEGHVHVGVDWVLVVFSEPGKEAEAVTLLGFSVNSGCGYCLTSRVWSSPGRSSNPGLCGGHMSGSSPPHL